MNERQLRSRGGTTILSPFIRVLLLVLLVALLFIFVSSFKILREKKNENVKKSNDIEDIKQELEIEEKKSNELNNIDDKVITNEDYEKMAREELGLIKKDEIVIKPR